jgi:hypothetical protein
MLNNKMIWARVSQGTLCGSVPIFKSDGSPSEFNCISLGNEGVQGGDALSQFK